MKVLIISHNPMNLSENNGRTLRNLFSGFNSGEVAQLFLHEGSADSPSCADYYSITDFDILQSLTRFKKPGKIITPEEINTNNKENKHLYGKYSRKTTYVRFLRDFAWGIGTWKTNKLKKWLNDFNPDVIFFYASDSVFSQKIAYWVKNYLDVPMLIYWVDDFYIKLKRSKNFFEWINQSRYKKIARENIMCSDNICITSSMAEAYKAIFKRPFEVLFNTSTNMPFPSKTSTLPIKLTYLGNISVGRYNSIIKIGEIIHKYGLPIRFDVYSGEFRKEILEKMNNQPGFRFMGEISYDQVKEVMAESDILLHVEDFHEENIDFCRYSLSTKIADSLMSNRCLLCYGPREVASIKYIMSQKCALVATDEIELVNTLEWICNNPNQLSEIASKALAIAENNHSLRNNNVAIKTFLKKAIMDKQ